MPLVQTRGAASAQGFGEFAVVTVPNYIEDVFSTYLYTGTNAQQTITNNIDLSTKGGLIWCKSRSDSTDHKLFDSAQAGTATNWDYSLTSNSTASSTYYAQVPILAQTTGFRINSPDSASINESGYTYASWTFREQPKFFDVVTWTGDGNDPRNISHSLGSVPGSIIIKCTSTSATDWFVYHRSLGNTKSLNLNQTVAAETGTAIWGSTTPTSTVFTVGNINANTNGRTYVAYLFAHDAGGFGLTGTDNVISCGSFTTDGSSNYSVTLGYEPQWVLWKRTNTTGNWQVYDNMRGMGVAGTSFVLYPDLSNAEAGPNSFTAINSTGFSGTVGSASQTYIYIAIRRGPMKVPTVGTSVFAPIARTGTGSTATVTGLNFPPDLLLSRGGSAGYAGATHDRLRGVTPYLDTTTTSAEVSDTTGVLSYNMNGVTVGSDTVSASVNVSGISFAYWLFGRAPSFFDEVCYTGTGSATTFSHNLGVAPELMIVKIRDGAVSWLVYNAPRGANYRIFLNTTGAEGSTSPELFWGNGTIAVAPTSSVFSIGSGLGSVNQTGNLYVAYLFATCAGVSKVGSYTGTGTTLQIDCGFTGGARFVLIKRTDSTGDWYVWDSARGIVAGDDPYLLLNSTAAEVTNTDYVDTYNAGFEISSTAPAAINASAGSFIFLAIA